MNTDHTRPTRGRLVLASALALALFATAACADTVSGNGTLAGGNASVAPNSPSGDFPSSDVPTSQPSSQEVPTSTENVPSSTDTGGSSGGGSCSGPPSGSTSDPGLKPEGIISDMVIGSLETPTDKYTTKLSAGTLKSYCYDNVKQTDLDFSLAFLRGAGYKRSNRSTSVGRGASFRSSGALTPKFVFITATGTLQLNEKNFNDNTGSVEIEWAE